MPSDQSLGDLLAELLDETPEVELSATREYAHNGVAFAHRTGEETIDLRLGDEIGEAALRTPDTHPSSRGRGWVAFTPRDWDDMAVDRLKAWFRVAWRLTEDR
ncbi:MAG TPA: hypothetical protein VM284_06155 [Candidatus Limnocylindria bacterium]|nr:hypothetical protein [Candidatus Limnocylindria bacterium]